MQDQPLCRWIATCHQVIDASERDRAAPPHDAVDLVARRGYTAFQGCRCVVLWSSVPAPWSFT